MASVSEDFFFADDFEAIMAVLEESEEVEEHFNDAVQEVQRQGITCNFCNKICKSKVGLKRHVNAKHKQSGEENQQEIRDETCKFTTNILVDMVNDVKAKISHKKVFSKPMRDELMSYQFEMNGESSEFTQLKKIYEGLVKNGDAEKFYAKYYGVIALNATKYFDGLSRNAATLLATKLADRILAHGKEVLSPKCNDADMKKQPLSEKEVAGLQYLGGYVLQNLHNKHKTSKNWKSSESQQAMSVLKACKEDEQNAQDSQKLISCLNRGGLWSPTERAQSVFAKTELYFRSYTCNPGKCHQRIDTKAIVQKSAQDIDIVSSFNAIISDSALSIDNTISKDILHCMIKLYVRVRSFSLAKDTIQKYKIKQKQVKAKALRKEIQRSSVDKEGRQP